jgi:hypothetical protein
VSQATKVGAISALRRSAADLSENRISVQKWTLIEFEP